MACYRPSSILGQYNRVISTLDYLNDNWQKGHGGELKIYEGRGKDITIAPLGNRLGIFKSDICEHEVLLTKSLTG